ncbi:MAG TPA: hypothetical protein VF006_16350 [Longimicrobium sp.]
MTERHGRENGELTVRLPMPDINADLRWMISEALLYAGSDRGRLAFERLTAILKRPALRIARVRLEAVLPRDQVGDDLINELVRMSIYRLYVRLSRYEPRMPVIPWFAELVEECAQDLVRRGRR